MEIEVAILMADLSGYTAMTDVHGGASAAKVVDKYMQLVENARFGNCRVVQRIGDQVVMISDEPLDLAITSQRLNKLTLEENDFLGVHAGLHFGKLFRQDDNLFGSTINVTSRIMTLAHRGQVLCSAEFVDKIKPQFAMNIRSMGWFKLKNIAKEIELFELPNLIESHPNLPIDPVCHMHVDPEKSSYSILRGGRNYYFCSKHCLKLFKADLSSGSKQFPPL